MCLASLSRLPLICERATRSLPAKSTKLSFEERTEVEFTGRLSSEMVKMQCDREDVLFIGVSQYKRLVSPRKSKFRASANVGAKCDSNPFSSTSPLPLLLLLLFSSTLMMVLLPVSCMVTLGSYYSERASLP